MSDLNMNHPLPLKNFPKFPTAGKLKAFARFLRAFPYIGDCAADWRVPVGRDITPEDLDDGFADRESVAP